MATYPAAIFPISKEVVTTVFCRHFDDPDHRLENLGTGIKYVSFVFQVLTRSDKHRTAKEIPIQISYIYTYTI